MGVSNTNSLQTRQYWNDKELPGEYNMKGMDNTIEKSVETYLQEQPSKTTSPLLSWRKLARNPAVISASSASLMFIAPLT
jgi:hypothetical protein